MYMKEMVIDLETRSDRDITKCGVYAYADSPFFKILLFSVSIDGGKIQLFDLANGDKIPAEILKALTDETVIKKSHNVNFERVCLSKYLRTNYPQYFKSYSINEDTVGDYLDPRGWYCTMVHCRYLGLPSSLADVGKALKLEEQKMSEGKGLIRYFCIPYDTANGIPLFHSRKDVPEKWEIFKAYNIRDVETEMAIEEKIKNFPVPDNIWEEFFLDQEINDRGIRVDMAVVRNAIRIDKVTRENLTAEMQDLTALDNPNSVQQMKEWLAQNGLEVDSLSKKEVQELLKNAPQGLAKVLMLRQQLANQRRELKRFTELYNDGAVARKQVDDIQYAISVLEKQIVATEDQITSVNKSIDRQMEALQLDKDGADARIEGVVAQKMGVDAQQTGVDAQKAAVGAKREALEAQRNNIDVQLSQIDRQIENTIVSSPLSGTIIEKYVQKGEYMAPGKPMFKVADTKNMIMRAYVTSQQLEKIKVGQKVAVTADYGNNLQHEYSGVVNWISPNAEFTPKTILTDDERADLVYAVKIAVRNDGGIKIGMYGKVRF